MVYLDTSLLVAAFTHETMTAQVQKFLSNNSDKELLISAWSIAEYSSALAIKVRTKQIDLSQRATASAIFNRLAAESLTVLDVASSHFNTAAKFADQYNLGLRAGDALHLAIAFSVGATVYTLDQRQAEAGPPLGVSTQLLK